MSSPSPRHLLKQAMTAARQGDRSLARMFLAKATELDPEDPLAWLWRAGLADEAEQALVWLNRALDLDPHLPQARRALPRVRIQAGIAVARYGDFHTARYLFQLAAEIDPDNVVPWLELASIARSKDELRQHLGEVLRRDPNHAPARTCLERLDAEDRPTPAIPPTPLSIVLPKPDPADDENAANDSRLIPVDFELPAEFSDPSGIRNVVPKATLLLIDDSAEIHDFVPRHLEPAGVRVLAAASAAEAWTLLKDHGPPDVILLDSVMPDIDYCQLGHELRQDPDIANVPIILLVNRGGVLPSFRGVQSTFNDRLTKPISPSSLKGMVGKYCPLPTLVDEDAESWPELPQEVLR